MSGEPWVKLPLNARECLGSLLLAASLPRFGFFLGLGLSPSQSRLNSRSRFGVYGAESCRAFINPAQFSLQVTCRQPARPISVRRRQLGGFRHVGEMYFPHGFSFLPEDR